MSESNYETCVTLLDRSNGKSYDLYVTNGALTMSDSEGGAASEIMLIDESTGTSYEVYSDDGTLMMDASTRTTGMTYIIRGTTLTEICDAIRLKEGSSDPIPIINIAQRITDLSSGLDTSDATAVEPHVLDGDTFYADGEKKTGTMPHHTVDNNDVVWAITSMAPTDTEAKTAVTIPEGYYEGGEYPTSPLAVRFPSDITPGTSDITVQGGAWFTNNFKVKGDANLVPENIKKNVTIFGVTGSHEGGTALSTRTLYLHGITDDFISIMGTVVGSDGSLSSGEIIPESGNDWYTCDVVPGTVVCVYVSNSWTPGTMDFVGCTYQGVYGELSRQMIVLSIDGSVATDIEAHL